MDCGPGEPACAVEAILNEDDVPASWSASTVDHARFFTEALPGAATVLGMLDERRTNLTRQRTRTAAPPS